MAYYSTSARAFKRPGWTASIRSGSTMVSCFAVRTAIERGLVVGVRRASASASAGAALDGSREQRRLVRKIDVATGGRLSQGGRQYKLTADADLDRLPDRNSYTVVDRAEAGRVLEALAESASHPLEALLLEARDKLTRDWRPPLSPDGLVLVRRMPTPVAAPKDTGPPIAPSQMRALIEAATLEIHVVDLDQEPQEGLAFQITKPDGGSESGQLDADGRARAKSSVPGTFVVTFPELDGADWDGDGALALPPEEERSEASKHKVEQGERLPTIARKQGFRRWQTVWGFAGNLALKESRGDAHILFPGDEVAIPSKVARVAEVPGGKAEYVVQSTPELLRVRFAEAAAMGDEPVLYRATPDAGGDAFEGELAEDGTLEIDLPPGTAKVVVELFWGEGDEPFVTHELAMGELDPIDKDTGIQARLAGLGYYDGKIDGDVGEVSRSAVARFRREFGLSPSDAIDDELRQALEWLHDDDDDTIDCEADQTTPDQTSDAGEVASAENDDGDKDDVEHDDEGGDEEGVDDDWLEHYLGHSDDDGGEQDDDEGDADSEEVTT
jgi:hypothetical protein